jgi:hypothetical protein
MGSDDGRVDHAVVVVVCENSSHTPALVQRLKLLWLLFQLPFRLGNCYQQAPLHNTDNTPSAKVRLSEAVLPRSATLPGRRSSILRRFASVSSYLFGTNHLTRLRMHQRGRYPPKCRDSPWRFGREIVALSDLYSVGYITAGPWRLLYD